MFKKNKWRNGAGEMLGFAIVAPFLFALVFLTISIYQITVVEEQLIYATYLCGREAVIQPNAASASVAGKKKLEWVYSSNGPFITGDGIMGVKVLGADGAEFSIDMGSGGRDITWLKGNVIIVSVSQDVRPMLSFLSGKRVRSLGMMIEHSELKINNSNYSWGVP